MKIIACKSGSKLSYGREPTKIGNQWREITKIRRAYQQHKKFLENINTDFSGKYEDVLWCNRGAICDFLLSVKREKQALEKKIENFPKKAKRRSNCLSKFIAKEFVRVIELCKGNPDSLNRFKSFVAPNGKLDRYLKAWGFEDLLRLPQVQGIDTDWANNLKENWVRGLVVSDDEPLPKKFTVEQKKAKDKMLAEFRNERVPTASYKILSEYEKDGVKL